MSYDYHSDICCAAEAGSCSFNGAVANLVVTAVGAGMLALPKAAASVGLLLAFALIVTVSFLTFFSSFVIVRYCAREKAESYGALVKSTFGAAGARVLQGAIIIHVFGVMVVYLIIISDMLVGSPPTWSGLLPYVLNEYSGPWWLTRWVVAAILVVTTVAPMLISRDLSVVSRFSRFSVGLLLLLAATLVCLAGTAVVQGKAADIKVLPDLETMGGGTVLGMISSVLTVLAVSALAFTIAFNLVPVVSSKAVRCSRSL